MIYYLTDISAVAMNDNSTQLPDHLVKSYAGEFSVSAQLSSFAQGLWHLDHGSVEVLEFASESIITNIIFVFYRRLTRS